MLGAIVIGLIVGVIAKFLMPGKDPGGFIITILLGIGGSVVAHWIGGTMGFYAAGEPSGFIAAIFGAILILFIYRMMVSKKIA